MEVMNNAPVLRFNGIQASLVSWQGLWLGTRLNRTPAALLNEMACRRLSAAGFAGVAELCNTLAQRFRPSERGPMCCTGGLNAVGFSAKFCTFARFCKILHVQ